MDIIELNLNNDSDKKKFYKLINETIKNEKDKLKIKISYKYSSKQTFYMVINHKTFTDRLEDDKFNYFNDAKKLTGIRIKIATNEKVFKKNCLSIWILKNKKGIYKFGYIETINKGICGLDKNNELKELFKGPYILKLVDTIFDIFNVKLSYLVDDSRINYEYKTFNKKFNYKFYMQLKFAGLFKYGKTWYEKTSGYKMVNNDFYKYGKKVKDFKIKTLINVIKKYENEDKYLKYYNREDVLENFTAIIKKMKKNIDNITIGDIYSFIFNKNSDLKQEEINFILDYIYIPSIDKLTDLYHKNDNLKDIYPKNITNI